MCRPVANRVVVEIDPVKEKKSDGGIIIADLIDNGRKELASEQGTIIAIGPTAFKDWGVAGEFKVGDHVHFKRYSGLSISDTDKADGPKFRVMEDEDIVLVDEE